MSDVAHIREDRDKTQSSTTFSSTATTATPVASGAVVGPIDVGAAEQRDLARQREVESAVYAYIRALRALGRERVNTVEIAKALGLPLKTVERTVANLTPKGVKIVG